MKYFRDLKVGDNLYVNGKPEKIWGIDKTNECWKFYTCSERHNSTDKLVERLRCYAGELNGNTIITNDMTIRSCEI